MRISEAVNWLNADPIPTQQWVKQHYSHFDPYFNTDYLKLRDEYRKKIEEKGAKISKKLF
jgi:hypothetical protein